MEAIIDEVEALLRPYDVATTRTRPASGHYDMVVLGGSSTLAGLPGGLQGVAPVDCEAGPTHVALAFDLATGHDDARQVITALGLGHAVPPYSAADDCLCSGAACTAATTMDEGALFRAAFGPHP